MTQSSAGITWRNWSVCRPWDLKSSLKISYRPVLKWWSIARETAPGINRALALVRPRGSLILKSTAAAAAPLNLAPIVINEVTVVGSRCGRFEPAIEAIASGKVDPRPFIDGTYPLDDFDPAFKAAMDPSNFKILLRM